jgi:sec-independent protein translocase protein TatC
MNTPNSNKNNIDSTRMSFGDHLMELRSRMIKSIYGLTIGFILCLFIGKDVLAFIAAPLLMALEASGLEPQLYAATVPEGFLMYVKVSLFSGIFVSSPWIFYQLWGFVAAGLYPHERRYVNVFMPFSAALFVLGGVFFMLVVAPVSFNFFITFCNKWSMSADSYSNPIYRLLLPAAQHDGAADSPPAPISPDKDAGPTATDKPVTPQKQARPLIKPWFTLQSYVSLVMMLALAFGAAFQMPLAVFFLGRLGLVKTKVFCEIRKYVVLGIVIFAGVITPTPDAFSQLALSVPMYLLYELGILLLKFWPTGQSQGTNRQLPTAN